MTRLLAVKLPLAGANDMIRLILRIRISQFKHVLSGLGWLRSGLLIVFACLAIALGVQKSLHPDDSIKVFSILLLLLGQFHVQRPDKQFLLIAKVNRYTWFLLEYASMSLPFVLAFAIGSHWYLALASIAFILLLPTISFTFKATNSTQPWRLPFLPARGFEWKSGLRKSAFPMLIVYLGGLTLSGYTLAVPISLVLLSLFTALFNMEAEPLMMLDAFRQPPKTFLPYKIVSSLKLYLFGTLPLSGLFLFWHAELWYILLYVLVCCTLVQVLAILLKYAAYSPNEDLSLNMTMLSLMHLCFVVPFLLPIPLLMAVRSYRKAITQLEFYLDATDR